MARRGAATTEERVTLQTIADRLGVSRTTVSNAYGRPDQLAPALRERILETAEELGYCGPNAAASALRRGRSGAVGLLWTEPLSYAVSDPAAVLFLQGLAEVFDEQGSSLLLLPAPVRREAGVGAAREAIVDAFLVYSVAEEDPRLTPILQRKLPIVIIDEPHLPGAAYIGVDDRGGARAVAQHLIDLGHRHFGVITFPMREDNHTGWASLKRQAAATFPVTRNRLLGYQEALTAAGVSWGSVPVYEGVTNVPEVGAAGLAALLGRTPRPTAILATGDQLALGALAAAKSHRLEVPNVLSIAGFDDVPSAQTSQPPLTTIRQPLREKGTAAARMVVKGWDPEQPPELILPTELVIRASTGPAPA